MLAKERITNIFTPSVVDTLFMSGYILIGVLKNLQGQGKDGGKHAHSGGFQRTGTVRTGTTGTGTGTKTTGTGTRS